MLGNTLTAPELLKNKGIRFKTWKKWDKTVETLPSKGDKQYEPNNSWLQNKQIEKGLKDREDLISIERVERSSQLAAAEWLSHESRARVTKRSGQEWTNFGLEENLELYLIPEEALLLLELNCLELTWDGVALSIQQAYNVLLGLDQSKCNIDEYRVYSHLVRQGYRLQRFRFEDGSTPYDRNTRSVKSSGIKRKKLIHDPLDGFGINRDLINAVVFDEQMKDCSAITSEEPQTGPEGTSNPNSDHSTCTKGTEKSNECETSSKSDENGLNGSKIGTGGNRDLNIKAGEKIDGCILNTETQPLTNSKKCAADNIAVAKKLPSELYDDGVINLPGPSNVGSKKVGRGTGKESKLQIISDETLIGDFKIISKWPGTRIQRNVKLMPKRNTDEILSTVAGKIGDSLIGETGNSVGKSSNLVGNKNSRISGVQNCSRISVDGDNSKGGKRERTQEVIEVSDDEIEEVPLKMSRMEMLNLFPNAICETFVAEQLPRRYLPHNVWPQKISNRYIKWKTLNDGKRENGKANVQHRNMNPHYNPSRGSNLNGNSVNYRNENSRQGSSSSFRQDFFETRTPYHRFSELFHQEHVSVQFGIYTNVAIAQSSWGNSQYLRRGLFHRQNIWTQTNYHQSRQNFVNFVPQSIGDRAASSNRTWGGKRYWNNNNNRSDWRTGVSSFKIVPGASSWAETKAKWLDEKTITIEDEDCVNDEITAVDDGEVEVMPRPVKPLIDKQNATSFNEVYKNLQIIKPATSENFRRSRKSKRTEHYKISYNLYSTGEHYKKANPGTPAYRIVVFRSEDTPFIELADIISLKKDAKETPILLACVSQTSITFAEIESLRIPDIQDNHSER